MSLADVRTEDPTPTGSFPVVAADQRPGLRFWIAVLALGTGGFAIGVTEFVAMGLLPEVSAGLGISISQGGHLISLYAAGVVVGAPLIAALGAKLPRRGLLVGLMAFYGLVNLASASVTDYRLLAVLRFLDGLPHGAYFGLAALVAASMVAPNRRGFALSMVMMGIPLANVVGVPLTTLVGQQLGWRWAYVVVGVLSLVTVVLVLLAVPRMPGDRTATSRREISGLRQPQLWFAVLAAGGGFGGMFALISYISPLTQDVGGLGESAVAVFLFVLGIGMVVGNMLAGRLCDWSVENSLRLGSVGLAVSLLAYFVLAPTGWGALVAAFTTTVTGSVLALGFQMRLIDAAGESQTLGAALSHSALNIGNGLGAWVGGAVIAAGWGFRSPLLVGALLAVFGLTVVVLAARARSAGQAPGAVETSALV
ncbi:MFS transporter [Nocardioides bruguierae]|uniref:MFS transporter n=1 Tax=Nocardioides bruguierae TaxID=2945102 RepID=UPI002021874D|nr:MFS transporter [Nocardioides bruguierae]MCL8025197.1 MFS transporter [Nocardioides bruguierae]